MISPAFDVTHSPGPLSRDMTILRKMRPSWNRVAEWLATAGIPHSTITRIRKNVLKALGQWKHYASKSGVATIQINAIDDEISAIIESVHKPV